MDIELIGRFSPSPATDAPVHTVTSFGGETDPTGRKTNTTKLVLLWNGSPSPSTRRPPKRRRQSNEKMVEEIKPMTSPSPWLMRRSYGSGRIVVTDWVHSSSLNRAKPRGGCDRSAAAAARRLTPTDRSIDKIVTRHGATAFRLLLLSCSFLPLSRSRSRSRSLCFSL